MIVTLLKPVASPWGSKLAGEPIDVPDAIADAWMADGVAAEYVESVHEPAPPTIDEQLAAVTAERDALAAELAALTASEKPAAKPKKANEKPAADGGA